LLYARNRLRLRTSCVRSVTMTDLKCLWVIWFGAAILFVWNSPLDEGTQLRRNIQRHTMRGAQRIEHDVDGIFRSIRGAFSLARTESVPAPPSTPTPPPARARSRRAVEPAIAVLPAGTAPMLDQTSDPGDLTRVGETDADSASLAEDPGLSQDASEPSSEAESPSC
jgi:hypothetical protein